MIELYYGVSLPPGCESKEEVDLRPVYTDQVEVLKVLKVYKEARFKVFRSEEEARQFSSQPLVSEALPKAIIIPDITSYGILSRTWFVLLTIRPSRHWLGLHSLPPSVVHYFDKDPDPAFYFDADPDPDPTFHSDADPDPDPTF